MRAAVKIGYLAVLGVMLLAGMASAGTAAEQPAGEAASIASDARIAGDDGRTRFVLDLSKRVGISAFTLAEPDRVVIDLPQVAFDLPARAGEAGRGLIKAFRFGLMMQGASRIVLDVTGPVRIDKAFVLDPSDGQPARLVVDLITTDREDFMRTIALENAPRRREDVVAKSQPTAKGDETRPVIVLDPGHGGIDNGTHSASGDQEKAIVLAFGLELREKLEKTGKYRVLMTRSDDRFVSLNDRVVLARKSNAALFFSIHADHADNVPNHDTEARGATVYTLSDKGSDAEAERLAEDENRADVISGVDLRGQPDEVADILIDLAQRETRTFSMHFAKAVVAGLKAVARLHKHPLKSAAFRVLKSPDVPSVLVELGYVSNREDVRLLTSTSWRGRASDAMVEAVNAYFATRLAGAGAAAGAN